MPKATKKKKEKQADFTRAKLKLGKGKKAPSNATDTSFKARSIALPGQNVLDRALAHQEGSAPREPTTAQGLTLDDVSIRLRHPNAGVKRDALAGIKEILSANPRREVGKTLRALGALVSDEDATVRKALINLLSWYLEQVPEPNLSPHLSLLILQVSSALSHIFPEIRLDACKLVHLLLSHVPSHVVGSWPRESSNILEGLRLAVGLGGEKGVNSQIGRLTGGAKLVTLRAMAEFVRCGLNAKEEDVNIFEGWIPSHRKRESKERLIRDQPTMEGLQDEGWLSGTSSAQGLVDLASGSDWELGRLSFQGDVNSEDNIVSVISQLYIQLHPLLLSTFLESAPTAFSPSQTSNPSGSSTEDIHLALCTTTASLTGLLARAILTRQDTSTSSAELKQVRSCISDFLKRMAAWFPFHTPRSQALTPSGIPPAFELSLVYAEMAVLLSPRPPTLVMLNGGARREGGWRARVKAVEDAWAAMREQEKRAKGKGRAGSADHWAMEEVAEWVVDILAPSKDALAQPITPAAYKALLPIIWALLVRPPMSGEALTSGPTDIGVAFLNHLSRQASTSNIKSVGDELLISIIHVHEQRHPSLPFYIPPTSEMRTLLKGWFDNVPKTLWELGNRDEKSTETLLRFLLDVGLRGATEQPYSVLNSQTFTTTSSKLAPFFCLQHPSKGYVPGPWTKLSPQSKKLGLDVVHVWSEWDKEGSLRRAAGMACKSQPEWEGYLSRLS